VIAHPNGDEQAPVSWATSQQAVRVILKPQHLRRTAATAAIVGTILFCINQLDVVVHGDATPVTWLKVSVTYLVPFTVSNIGVLIGTRHET
jgi:hypothetical protein